VSESACTSPRVRAAIRVNWTSRAHERLMDRRGTLIILAVSMNLQPFIVRTPETLIKLGEVILRGGCRLYRLMWVARFFAILQIRPRIASDHITWNSWTLPSLPASLTCSVRFLLCYFFHSLPFIYNLIHGIIMLHALVLTSFQAKLLLKTRRGRVPRSSASNQNYSLGCSQVSIIMPCKPRWALVSALVSAVRHLPSTGSQAYRAQSWSGASIARRGTRD